LYHKSISDLGLLYDADVFSKQLGMSAADLMRIGKYEAVAKILIDNDDTTPFTLKTKPSPDVGNPRLARQIERSMKINGVWQDRQELLDDIDTRMDKIKELVNQKESEEKDKEEKEQERLKEVAEKASQKHFLALKKVMINHEISIWIDLFLIDIGTEDITSFGEIRPFFESLVNAVMGLDINDVADTGKPELIKNLLNIFHNFIISHARAESPYYYHTVTRAYDSKDKSVFDNNEMRLFFKNAYHEYLNTVSMTWVSDNE
jgi:hypothetical protein